MNQIACRRTERKGPHRLVGSSSHVSCAESSGILVAPSCEPYVWHDFDLKVVSGSNILNLVGLRILFLAMAML